MEAQISIFRADSQLRPDNPEFIFRLRDGHPSPFNHLLPQQRKSEIGIGENPLYSRHLIPHWNCKSGIHAPFECIFNVIFKLLKIAFKINIEFLKDIFSWDIYALSI